MDEDGFFVAQLGLPGAGRTGLLGAADETHEQRHDPKRKRLARQAAGRDRQRLDERLQVATPLRRLFNKVFPDHWSFLLGEIALYSFIVLLLTGTFLALFFDPSMAEVSYNGSYAPLRGHRDDRRRTRRR